jgi:choline-sulfatase
MDRRTFTAGLAGTAAGLIGAPGRAAEPDKRVNLLVIFMDDQTYRSIGSLNNPEVKTPNLDRLVARGTTFTHAVNQGSWTPAICVASRAMLHSGLTLFHAKERFEKSPLWGEVLGRHGYRTFMTGKWHNSETSLTRSFQDIGPHGGGMYESTRDAYGRPAPGNTWSPTDTTAKGHWIRHDGQVIHSSELWANSAIRFLKENGGKQDRPFFLYLAFHAPHDPRQSPPEFVEIYRRKRIEIPPNFAPEHPFDQGDHKIRDELLAPFPRTPEAVRLHRQEYYAILSHADRQIGRVLDTLEAVGAAANTLVVFSGDHGLAVGQHGLMGKQNQYDHSVRMPLIFAGPGVPAGTRVDALVHQNGLYPTTCELLGVPVPREVETKSLAGLIRGHGKRPFDAVFGGYRELQRMVRTDEHKLILYPEARRTQLFDLRRDPWETDDLSGERSKAALVRSLTERLQALQHELDDPLRL